MPKKMDGMTVRKRTCSRMSRCGEGSGSTARVCTAEGVVVSAAGGLGEKECGVCVEEWMGGFEGWSEDWGVGGGAVKGAGLSDCGIAGAMFGLTQGGN